ncbi:MAG: hypothetical protein QG608_850 [Actinomycetota bacterium]|nr:hypothetical protein [Actinomycetota bacterium]
MSILDDALALTGSLVDLRHRLHQRPEIGLDLPLTQRTVLSELDGLGLEITTGRSCTSVTAVLRGGADPGPGGPRRPTVLLRGDMDALPVQEEVEVPYRSQVPGVMHACGHDLHTTMLVGAARVLAARREDLPGDVIFMFQPGEEGFDGASKMIAEGVLDVTGERPQAAYALHVMSSLTPRGTVISRPGPLMAASDGLSVTVRGRGGHGSSPQTAADPIPAACEMVLALQTALSRTVSAFDSVVLTVGSLHAGTKRNVIPDTACFEATLRTFSPTVRDLVVATAERVCQGVAAAHGVGVEVRFEAEYPVTVNDAVETAFALGVAEELSGRDRVFQMDYPIAGAEDFSRVLAEVPGVMLFLGAMTQDTDPTLAPTIHSPRASFDDGVLPQGTALLATLATRRLSCELARD